jgi:large conductance mechanosensitive channel
MLREFREFAMRGNVVDLAVGVIIGAAFGAIVKSLVSDIILPPIGLLLGNVDFSNLFIVLQPGSAPAPYDTLTSAQEAGAVTINYGLFLDAVLTFLITAFAIFLLVRAMNRMRRTQDAPPPAPTTKECPYCKSTVALAATRCAYCTSELQTA